MTSDPFDLDSFEESPPQPMLRGGVDPAYLKDLNAPQRQAVEATEGPILVLAGAGTGKTRVLTTRIAHLIATGRAYPGQILAVTFTNKAAREMGGRVEALIGQPVAGLWMGTFHSISARILRRHAELVGLKSNFTILDTDDQIRLLKQLLAAENLDDKRWPARMLAGLIDRWKNRAWSPDQVAESESYAFADGMGQKLYAAYQARLKTLNACDFGDLLLHCTTLLQKNPDVLADYHRRFHYVLVDEYQDTNVAQYLWLRLLAQSRKNICCVGDDDQSVYGWRGAEIKNILRFEEDFPGAGTVRLEQNYRSTGHILAAAGGLIATNEGRLGKTLWTEAGDGEKVTVQGVWDAQEEARVIGENVENRQSNQESLDTMAVLVRAGFQTREFEDRFITLGVPYRVIGGPRFYERQEIRDAMAYLRVIAQPDDDLAFERIVNVPKRGLGNASIQKLHHLARSHGISMTRAARQIVELEELRPQARNTLTRLMGDFDRWQEASTRIPHTELAETILEESGYTAMWQADKSPDAPGRLDNLAELIRAMESFENLQGFLEHIALVMENDEAGSGEKLSIMTLHGAKGLEFDTVFLPGWEEGVFPNQRSLDEGGLKSLEEERRLAYVGITRAKKKAHILFAGSRRIFGQWQSSIPSRFIDELPAEHLEQESAQGIYRAQGSRYTYGGMQDSTSQTEWHEPWDSGSRSSKSSYENSGTSNRYGPGWRRASDTIPKTRAEQASGRRGITIEGSATKGKPPPSTVSEFAIGERVFHDKFGYGMVEDVEGRKLLVSFEHGGEKRVMDSFVSRDS